MNLEQITLQSLEIIRETGSYIRSESLDFNRNDVEVKALHDYVTYVDKTAEQLLYKGLKDLIPGAAFLAEEETIELSDSKVRWIIDPLDGTTNFIHNIPVYCISVALEVNGKIRIGIVYEINRDEMFYSWDGADAMLNGEKIRVSQTADLVESMLATGFPYSDYSHLDAYMALLRNIIETGRGIRRLGSAAADLAYVACGRFDAFFEYGLNPWDVAAGAFLVKQAGGKVFDFEGKNNYIYGKEIVAVNSKLSKNIKSKVKNYFDGTA